MNFKLIIILFFFLFSCTTVENYKKDIVLVDSKFSNKGFTLVYENTDKVKSMVSKNIEERSLVVAQRNLEKGAAVKITNLLNGKSIIGQVSSNINYPKFYNSVISKRISLEIELDKNEPYVEIVKIGKKSTFIAKKAKTFDEEKKVANKAPVEGVSINNLNSESIKKEIKKVLSNNSKNNFKYIIKIADFYFENSAKTMKNRILNELKMKNTKISKLSSNNYRVYIGPFKNINDLKINYNIVSQLEFENIEIIKK